MNQKNVARSRHDELSADAPRAESLCIAIEKLAKTRWDKLYEHRLLHLKRQWRALESGAEADLKQRFCDAEQLCGGVIHDHQHRTQAPQRQAALVKQLEQAITERTKSDCSSLDNRGQLDDYQKTWHEEDEIHKADRRLRKRWEGLLRDLANYCTAVERVQSARGRIAELLQAAESMEDGGLSGAKTILDEIKWPPSYAAPAPLQSVLELHEQLTHEQQAEQLARTAATQKVEQLMAQLRTALRLKQTRRAVAIHRELHKKLERLDADERQRYQGRVSDLAAIMQELLDWKAFASEPKIAELCAAMEELAKNPRTAPRAQLGAIKLLQRQWSKLGYSAATQEHWAQFRKITEKALEPCAQFIAQRKAQLERNQQYVEQACAKLERCVKELDEQAPNWEDAKAVYESAAAAMKNNRGLPKENAETIRKRYHSLCEQWQQKLQSTVQAHESQKQVLLERAQKVALQKDSAQQERHARLLLGNWERLLKGPNEDRLYAELEQILAEPLKLFQQAKDQERDRLSELREQVRANIQTINRWTTLDGEELTRAGKEYEQLLGQTDALLQQLEPTERADKRNRTRGRPGKARAQKIGQDFKQACHKFEQHLAKSPKRQQDAQQKILLQYIQLCQQLEWSSGNERKRMVKEFQDKADTMIAQLDKKIAKRLAPRTQEALANKYTGDAVQRKLLCIRMEILAELQSPEEDQKARNDYLMAQMQQGKRLGALSAEESAQQVRELYLQYLCGPVADRDTEQVLAPRAEQALSTSTKKIRQPAGRNNKATKRRRKN